MPVKMNSCLHSAASVLQQLSALETPLRAVTPAGMDTVLIMFSSWILFLHFLDPSATPRRGRDLWSKLRQTVKQTTLADVLNALGAIPSGFRDSTMSKLLKDSCKPVETNSFFGFKPIPMFNPATYLTSSWIVPHPSATGLAFKDLKWHHAGDHLLPAPTKISHEVAILMARKIPLPGKGATISYLGVFRGNFDHFPFFLLCRYQYCVKTHQSCNIQQK